MIKKTLKEKWMRIIIISITLIVAFLTIIFGSILYTTKNTKTGIDYGGGAQVSLQIKDSKGNIANDQLTKTVFNHIVKRVDPLGVSGVENSSTIRKNGFINIVKGGIKTNDELKKFQDLIITKPILGVYTLDDKSLFVNGVGQTNGGFTTKNEPDEKFKAPFTNAKTRYINNKWSVEVTLKNAYARKQWTKITKSLSSSTKNGVIVIWLDHQKLKHQLQQDEQLNKLLSSSSDNLFKAIQIPDQKKNVYFWEELFINSGILPAKEFMISVAKVDKVLSKNSFIITGNFDRKEANELTTKINYGVSNYKIKLQSSYFLLPEYGIKSFHKAIIAGIIVFSLIAIFMIINYRILGIISAISIALYIFLTLTMFTIMRGEHSPETIAALIIGIGMSVDANIITFERLKKEVRSGYSPTKAYNISKKISFFTIFDANITTLIVGFILFYFGTTSIKGFSIMLIISVIFTLAVILLFTRLISTLLIMAGLFNGRLWLMGVNSKKINSSEKIRFHKTIYNFNYFKKSKWFVLGSSMLITASLIVFGVMSGIAGKFSGGINLSSDFSGGSTFIISSNKKMNTEESYKVVDNIIKQTPITKDEVQLIYKTSDGSDVAVKVKTQNSIEQKTIKDSLGHNHYQIIGQTITSDVAKLLVKNAIIAITIAMLSIVIYILIRFKWTFSISAILALVHDGLIVTAVFIFTRIQVSPIFIAGILSVIGYSINDTIVIFDKIREKMKSHKGSCDKKILTKISNLAIRDTLKRSILTSSTTIVAVLVLMMFGNATELSFNIVMLVGIISGTYSSIFIATYIWVILETFSKKLSAKRASNGYWKLKEQEEQVIDGINDFTN